MNRSFHIVPTIHSFREELQDNPEWMLAVVTRQWSCPLYVRPTRKRGRGTWAVVQHPMFIAASVADWKRRRMVMFADVNNVTPKHIRTSLLLPDVTVKGDVIVLELGMHCRRAHSTINYDMATTLRGFICVQSLDEALDVPPYLTPFGD